MKEREKTNWRIFIEFDDTPLTEEENRQAEEMLKSLWLGHCLLPDDVDNVCTVTSQSEEEDSE